MNVDPLFTRLNPLLRWLLRSPLHFLASRGLVLLTIRGRRTGREYTIPVGYQVLGEEPTELPRRAQSGEREAGTALVVMVSHAHTKQWWRNFRDAGAIGVHLRGREWRGTARVVEPGSREFHDRCDATFRRLPLMGAQFGIRFDRRAGLDDEQLAHLCATCAVVRIDLAHQPLS